MGKAERLHFSVSVVSYDKEMLSTYIHEYLRSRSFSNLDQRLLISYLLTFSKDFASETTGQFQLSFIMQPSGKERKKFYIFDPGHMPKMAAMSVYGKKIKKRIIFSRTTDCLEI